MLSVASSFHITPSHLQENNKDRVDKYQCPVCSHILKDAVQTSCGHWMCNGCAEGFFKDNYQPVCPRDDCKEELTDEDGRPFFPDRFVRKEISRFTIKCLNTEFGCKWIGSIGEFTDHLKICSYNGKKCPHCNLFMTLADCEEHISNCPEAMIFCPLKDFGCKYMKEMTRKECQNHLSSEMASHFNILVNVLKLPASSLKELVERDSPPTLPQKNDPPQSATYRNVGNERIGTDGEGAGASTFGSHGPSSYDLSFVVNENKKKNDQIQHLQQEVQDLKMALSKKVSENEDRDFRLSLMENGNYDGSMVWKIPQFSQRREDARTGKYTSIFSLPFYSGRYGYKMCLRLYILGDGIGKGTHMSLFFVIMKGEFDNILQWPFNHKVTFKLINQCGGRDIVDVFQPDPLSNSFQKPKSDMNIASGCPRFVSSNELMQGGFISDDTVFIKVKVDTTTMRHP